MGTMSEMDLRNRFIMEQFGGDIFDPDDDGDTGVDDAESQESVKEDSPASSEEPEDPDGIDTSEADGVADTTASDKPSGEGNKSKPSANPTENAAEREKKRKAEWEEKQRQKKAKLDEQRAKIEAMSSQDVLSAAQTMIMEAAERLTRRNMKIEVANAVKERCMTDLAFARNVMDPKKDFNRCIKYITTKAMKYLKEEAELQGETGGSFGSYCGDVPDGLCYDWAVEYYNTPDLEEDKDPEDTYKPGYVPRKTKASKTTASTTQKGKDADKKGKGSAKAVLTLESKDTLLSQMTPLM